MLNPANYSTISFPLLGIEIDPIRYFNIGPLTIHLYGVVIAFGLLLAGVYCSRRSKRAGLTEDDILDGILWITPFAVICARIYYCVFSWADYADNPISVLYIWNGGLAIYGAVIGAFVGVAIYCRIKKCALPALLDWWLWASSSASLWAAGATSSTGRPSRAYHGLLPHGPVQYGDGPVGILPPHLPV